MWVWIKALAVVRCAAPLATPCWSHGAQYPDGNWMQGSPGWGEEDHSAPGTITDRSAVVGGVLSLRSDSNGEKIVTDVVREKLGFDLPHPHVSSWW